MTDVCQYIHSVSHVARTNEQQMNLAAKLPRTRPTVRRISGEDQDQLLSVGRDGHQEDGYTGCYAELLIGLG